MATSAPGAAASDPSAAASAVADAETDTSIDARMERSLAGLQGPGETHRGVVADPALPATVGTVLPWWLPVLRAVPALAAAIVIAFTGGHSPFFGLVVFAGWAATTAVIDLVGWFVLPKGLARTVSLGRAVVGVLGALLAGLAASGALGGDHDVERTAMLTLTAAATLIVIGMLDAAIGTKLKGADAYARDWTTTGAIQVIAAIAVMFVPPGFEHRYQVEDVNGILTGAIMVIGLLGAAAAILGVLQVIAGISLRSTRVTQPTEPTTPVSADAGEQE